MEVPKQESRGHKQDTWLYFVIGAALLVLTALTFLASYVNWGDIIGGGFLVNIGVAVFIASMKAFLVLHFFMHVRFENNLIRVFGLIYPLFLFLLLVGFLLLDVLLRVHPNPS